MKLAFISNESRRKQSFTRRMKGLKKKLSELNTLCGIDACAIVCCSYEPQPEVWPNHMGVRKVLDQFLRMPVYEWYKNMMNLESYIKDRIKKVDEQMKKQIKKNSEQEMTVLMYKCLIDKMSLANLNMTILNDLGVLVDHNLSEINSRIESLKKARSQPHQASSNNLTRHMVASGKPGHELSSEMQPMAAIPETMDEMQLPKSFMDLLMGPEETGLQSWTRG